MNLLLENMKKKKEMLIYLLHDASVGEQILLANVESNQANGTGIKCCEGTITSSPVIV